MNDLRSSLAGFVDVSVGSQNVSTHTSRASLPRLGHESVSAQNWGRPDLDNTAVYPGQAASAQVFQARVQESAALKSASKWKQHLFSIHGSTDVDSISETVEYVFEAMTQHGPTGLDLRGVASNSVNAEHLVAVLRATAANRDAVPGWAHALGEAPAALRRFGLDPDEVLVGLTV